MVTTLHLRPEYCGEQERTLLESGDLPASTVGVTQGLRMMNYWDVRGTRDDRVR